MILKDTCQGKVHVVRFLSHLLVHFFSLTTSHVMGSLPYAGVYTDKQDQGFMKLCCKEDQQSL
jgi:hypothetical protein